ncbi:WXG100 family type VII secretion target [Mycobacterium asiaticum]|uniref:Uncharacterized protein n=1 Tax=Mycobacterium asiaticum TaxID=1790 RepID=A0A1A3NS89_MYCAS|nr:WXG100 family type VII secretion target [Mycobacterium asiaticum]OBK24786.1 hypothetical protein A5635_17090 [Mycobacterium asiaticum]
MADRLDVAGRLAEGLPAVEHTETYARACHDPLPVRDLYGSEDGLDLYALDADCARLREAATVIAEALRSQRAQVSALTQAWTGAGADAAVAFVQRHCDTADAVVTELRGAAEQLESLRDNLWYLVDSRVTTTVAVDERTEAQRPVWLAAAAAVTAGAGDRTAAREVVERQIKPFVDNVIRQDWLTAMRAATASVAASYDMVVDRLAAVPRASFEIPGDLGPSSPLVAAAATPAVVTVSAPVPGFAAASSTPPVTEARSAAPAPVSPNVPLAQPDSGMLPSGVSGMTGGGSNTSGGGLGGGGDLGGLGGVGGLGGLGGLASRIVEAMGGLLDSTADPPGDDAFGMDPDDDPDGERKKPRHPEPDGATQVAKTVTAPGQPAAEQPAPGQPAGSPPAGSPAATPMGQPMPAQPPPIPVPAGKTPCEIAADELPKAGQ